MFVQFALGSIMINFHENGIIMLEKPCGEAMEIGRVELERLLLQYYDENF